MPCRSQFFLYYMEWVDSTYYDDNVCKCFNIIFFSHDNGRQFIIGADSLEIDIRKDIIAATMNESSLFWASGRIY